MNPVEERVRRALEADVTSVSTEDLLASVHRGAARRRSRRTAVVAAAAVVLVTGGVAVPSQWGDEPPPSPSPAPEPSEDVSLPPGAASGVIDVSVTGAGQVFRLTTNVGCVGCSTVWRQAGRGWERLHDFEELLRDSAPVGKPVTYRFPSNQRRHVEKLRRSRRVGCCSAMRSAASTRSTVRACLLLPCRQLRSDGVSSATRWSTGTWTW